MALVRAADSEQDAAIYLTAAFPGLRQGELIALRWRTSTPHPAGLGVFAVKSREVVQEFDCLIVEGQ
jgi:hypothetical protein